MSFAAHAGDAAAASELGTASESEAGPGPGASGAGVGSGPGAEVAAGAGVGTGAVPELCPGVGLDPNAAPELCPGLRPGGPVRVRPARTEDLGAVVAAVRGLLAELGSTPPPVPEMLAAAEALYEDPSSGALLVAEADGGELVGVLVASFQIALHVPGRYAVIQDLWVGPAWRSRAIGRELLAALCELAGERGMARAEVGLPRESFQNIEATAAFYARNGFSALGPRMRRTF